MEVGSAADDAEATSVVLGRSVDAGSVVDDGVAVELVSIEEVDVLEAIAAVDVDDISTVATTVDGAVAEDDGRTNVTSAAADDELDTATGTTVAVMTETTVEVADDAVAGAKWELSASAAAVVADAAAPSVHTAESVPRFTCNPSVASSTASP